MAHFGVSMIFSVSIIDVVAKNLPGHYKAADSTGE
jgi:hypothetical protein